MYREEILDHYKRPRNTGALDAGLEAQGENKSCGDDVHVYIKAEDGAIQEIKHETEGCAICTASTSILSEKLIGKNPEEVKDLDSDWLQDELELDLSPMRIKCGMLPVKTIQKALKED
jgi:nitrogen fixation NifU-like protein